MAVCQGLMCWLIHRYREQAPSHMGIAFRLGDLDLSHRGCRKGLATVVVSCIDAYSYARIRRLVRLDGHL
ncbi:hypothetical protein PsexTeo8_04330 [Pseudomonas extremaustralis]|nr:hypothetical protein [Pseudomonas extremaustralis]